MDEENSVNASSRCDIERRFPLQNARLLHPHRAERAEGEEQAGIFPEYSRERSAEGLRFALFHIRLHRAGEPAAVNAADRAEAAAERQRQTQALLADVLTV